MRQVEVCRQGRKMDLGQWIAAVRIVEERTIPRVVDDVLRKGRGLRADDEVGAEKRVASRSGSNPGEDGLRQHDLFEASGEIGDLVDLVHERRVKDEPIVARPRGHRVVAAADVNGDISTPADDAVIAAAGKDRSGRAMHPVEVVVAVAEFDSPLDLAGIENDVAGAARVGVHDGSDYLAGIVESEPTLLRPNCVAPTGDRRAG